MIPGKRGVRSRFEPSNSGLGTNRIELQSDTMLVLPWRILELAQHKTSRTVWATTPWWVAVVSTFGSVLAVVTFMDPVSLCEKLVWGNQEPIRPVSMSALRAVPSARIQYLAQHKRAVSAWEDPRREEEAASFFRKTQGASSKTSQYENAVRLSTPKPRSSSREARPGHIHPRVEAAVVPARLLQLSSPKRNHPDYQGSRQSVASIASSASRARVSQRLVQLSLPKVKESNICHELGRPHESVWTVSRAARRGAASPRVERLAQAKQLSKDYIPPREPGWSRRVRSA